MTLDKNKYNIYLVTAVIGAALIFMAVSLWKITQDVSNQSSVDIAIDKRIDECWAKKGLDDQ